MMVVVVAGHGFYRVDVGSRSCRRSEKRFILSTQIKQRPPFPKFYTRDPLLFLISGAIR